MKRNNPNVPILIREAAGTQPKVYARYGSFSQEWLFRLVTDRGIIERGTEKSQILEGLSDKEIEDTVSNLVKAA